MSTNEGNRHRHWPLAAGHILFRIVCHFKQWYVTLSEDELEKNSSIQSSRHARRINVLIYIKLWVISLFEPFLVKHVSYCFWVRRTNCRISWHEVHIECRHFPFLLQDILEYIWSRLTLSWLWSRNHFLWTWKVLSTLVCYTDWMKSVESSSFLRLL